MKTKIILAGDGRAGGRADAERRRRFITLRRVNWCKQSEEHA